MKSFTFVLSSVQQLAVPAILNHYLFADPVFGTNFVYPNTAYGSLFTSTTGSFVYPVTASGGPIYPWGYPVQNLYYSLSTNAFKGPVTVTFSPSGLDTRLFAISKIIYDFNDNSESLIVEKDIVPNLANSFQWDGDPASLPITRTYYPLSETVTTYNPTVTVIDGNLCQHIYSINFSLFPVSLYELGDMRLLNAFQPNNNFKETFGVFEFTDPNYVTNVKLLSTIELTYNLDINFLPTYFPGLVLWLDASSTDDIYRNNINQVLGWLDSSDSSCHFYQIYNNNQPRFYYENETLFNRRAVNFVSNSQNNNPDAQYMVSTNTSALSTITGGYTMCCVMACKNTLSSGNIFSQNAPYNAFHQLDIQWNNQNGVTIYQGNSTQRYDITNIGNALSTYGLFTFTVTTTSVYITVNDLIYTDNNISFTFNPNTYPMLMGKGLPSTPGIINANSLLDTDISEIILYNHPLTVDEIKLVKAYLTEKWSIPSPESYTIGVSAFIFDKCIPALIPPTCSSDLTGFGITTTSGNILIDWGDGIQQTLPSGTVTSHDFFCPHTSAFIGFWTNINPCIQC